MKKKTEPAQPDIAKMSAKLRLQACALLRLDPEKLSPGDEVLVASGFGRAAAANVPAAGCLRP